MSDSLWPRGLQHARLPCPSLSPGVCSNSCPLNWWRYLTISSSATPLLLLPSGGGNGKPLQYSCGENPMNSTKRQKYMTPEDEPPRSEGVQYATGEEWRAITNGSKKNGDAGPKWKWCSAVDVPGAKSQVQCHKEQYCIGTWNVRSMNQGKLDVVKQEMARVNISTS